MAADSKKNSDPRESKFYVTAVERAVSVLSAFDSSHRHLSMSQLSELTGLDISAIQRFTYTLTTLGYLRRDPGTKKFEVSPRLLNFAHLYLAANETLSKAMPYLQRLADETEEIVNLSVLDGTDMILVSRIITRHAINPNIQVGSHMPAFCTASGLAWLAELSEEQINDVLRSSTLKAYTQYTETRIDKIFQRVQEVRKVGYAFTQEEYRLGGVSTAGAICDRVGKVQGSISVTVATPRWNQKTDPKRYADLLLATCSAISNN